MLESNASKFIKNIAFYTDKNAICSCFRYTSYNFKKRCRDTRIKYEAVHIENNYILTKIVFILWDTII